MPSIAAHLALATGLEGRLGIREDSFLYGSVLPDFVASRSPQQKPKRSKKPKRGYRLGGAPEQPRTICIPDPHYRVRGAYCLVPDLETFWKENELPGYLKLGYAAHLLLDKMFLEEFCPQQIRNFSGLDLFTGDKIYEDYTRLSPRLVQSFGLDLARINRVLNQEFFYIPIDDRKHEINVTWINNLSERPPAQYIDFYDFVDFIREATTLILEDAQFRTLAGEIGCYLAKPWSACAASLQDDT